MRLANCKTVCCEIDELNVDQDLSGFAKEHVQGCERCQTFYDGRRQLRTLLGGLEAIEAPADFDFRVRARLASGEAERHVGFFGSRSFGMPAAALATVGFLLVAGFALRTLVQSNNPTTAVQKQPPAANQLVTPPEKQERIAHSADAPPSRPAEGVRTSDKLPNANPNRQRNVLDSFRHDVGSSRTSNRVATLDISTTPAEVVKRDNAVASLETFPVFAVETPSETLKVSLDYETGVSRTISLPTLSFGSERALAPSGTVVKTSAKGVW